MELIMLLVGGQNPMGNLIHIVMGEESHFAMDVHGCIVVNITDVLNSFDQARPVFLHVTRCASETDTAETISTMMKSNMSYPFQPPHHVFLRNTPQTAPQAPGQPAQQPSPNKVSTVAIRRGKCQWCAQSPVELVPKLSPAICYECATLNMKVAAQRSPPPVPPPPQPAEDMEDE